MPQPRARTQEPHGPTAGQQNKLSTVLAAGSKASSPQLGREQEHNGRPPLLKPAGQWPPLFDKAAGVVGLYHVHPCSSSCFLAPQQAFVGEMGQKGASVVASSTFFEKGRNFSKQVGR